MAAATDLQLDGNGDLLISNNDFSMGLSDQQHIQDIINSDVGWWKESYTTGVGIRRFLNSAGQQQDLERKIKIELQQDGYTVSAPSAIITPDKTTINPNAIRN